MGEGEGGWVTHPFKRCGRRSAAERPRCWAGPPAGSHGLQAGPVGAGHLHTLGTPTKRASIAVAGLAEPLDWAGTRGPLVLLVAFRGADRTFFREVFAQLVISLTELHNVRQLVEHGTTLYDCVAQWVS